MTNLSRCSGALGLLILGSLFVDAGQPPDEMPAAPVGAPAVLVASAFPKPETGDPDARTLPIDLPTALRLADANNPTIALAQARLREAYARLREARAQILPDLNAGPSYMRHDGLIQNSTGLVFPTSKWNFFIGGGAALSLHTSDALFGPLVARRLVDAQSAAAQAVSYDIQLQAALAYLDLVRVYGALAINAESLANSQRMYRLAVAAEKAKFGKTPADVNRMRTELEVRRQEREDLQGEAGVVSARLVQLLILDPAVDLWPAESAIVPISLVSPETSLDELIATGLMNRPELAESRALVAAALANWRRQRLAPLFPRIDAGYTAGQFRGGIDDDTQRIGGRGDAAVQAVWTLRNFGVGDLARSQVGRAQYDQANSHVAEVQARVSAEVAAAAKLVRSRQRTFASAQEGVRQAEIMWRRLLVWTEEVPRPAKQYEAVDLLLAEQALHQARNQYLNEVMEFNRAQFRLYWAMGQPPLCAPGQETTVPVAVPVLPPQPEALPPPKRERD